MQHSVVYPLISHPVDPVLFSGEAVARFARAAEAAGFDGISFTDHPAPSQKWLSAGGHDALDPFAALSFVAGVASRLRLIPHIVVLPYRNPFLVAKAAATIDALSGGRFVLSVGTGYLRSEYRALGVEFEERNALVDEALEVLRGVWANESFSYEGRHFTGSSVTANPRPGHVPIWIGGNSALTRRRVASSADGWNPFPAPPGLARTARTPPLGSLAELTPLIADLHRLTEAAGRDPASIDIQFGVLRPPPGSEAFSAAEHLEQLAEMGRVGVTWSSLGIPSASLDQAIEAMEQYGADVIAASR